MDARTGVVISAEFVEGKVPDSKKWGYDLYGATTSTTLRLVKPWFGSGKVVIGDSWFGSLSTCEELKENGLHSILSIKNGHAGFPKQELLDLCKERGDTAMFKCDVQLGWEGQGDEATLYASGHMDKKPLLLVSDCGLLIEGPERERHRFYFEGGSYIHRVYKLK